MFLGSQTLTAAATTAASDSSNTLLSASPGSFITTTVTFNGKTSEFSQCIVVTAGDGLERDHGRRGVARDHARGGPRGGDRHLHQHLGPAVDLTSFTATLPPGFALVRNSTTVGGVSTTEPTSSEPAALGGSLVRPRSGGNPPPQWPLQLPAGGSRVITFGLAAPATPVGPPL